MRRKRRIFRFSADMCGGKTPCKRKTAYSAVFQGYWGEYPRSITTDCRLWGIKGGCYGAAVKENSRSKRLFSLGTARVGSAVRKSVIFERAAFPSKSVSTFSTRSAPTGYQPELCFVYCGINFDLNLKALGYTVKPRSILFHIVELSYLRS